MIGERETVISRLKLRILKRFYIQYKSKKRPALGRRTRH